MKKTYRLQEYVVRGKEIFVGLEDSKRTWKLAVRSEKMIIHQVSMEAKYPVLIGYLRSKFPECMIHLIYEAGFKGFNLYDALTEDGIDCVVIPPHVVTEPKVNRIKTDKRDARRLAKVLEDHDFQDSCYVPDKERREDRQVSRTLIALQKDIVRTRNRIRKLLQFHGVEVPFPDRWGRDEFRALKKLEVSEPLRISLDIFLTQLEELWAHQVSLRAALRKLCRKERYHKAFTIARSLPGIGWFTAIRFVLELGRISRVSRVEKRSPVLWGSRAVKTPQERRSIRGASRAWARGSSARPSSRTHGCPSARIRCSLGSSPGYGMRAAAGKRRSSRWHGC